LTEDVDPQLLASLAAGVIPDGQYGVTWLIDPTHKVTSFHIGMCHATRGVAFLTRSDLEPMVVRFVWVKGGRCQERVGCLDHKCPLNKLDYRHWRKLSSIAYLFKTEKRYRELIGFRNEFDDAIKQDNDEMGRVELGVKVGTHLPMKEKMLE
jgi:hypothetical protein